MSKSTPNKRHGTLQRLLEFAAVWNDRRIRIRHELQQVVQRKTGRTKLPTWEELWKMRGKYNRFLKKRPELLAPQEKTRRKARTDPLQPLLLPRLIIRQYSTGEPKELPPFVEEHLDEWKYPRKRIKQAIKEGRGFVIGSYQWGSVPAQVLYTAWMYAKQRGFEFIVGLSQYGRIEVDCATNELITVLPDKLRGHIVVDNVRIADYELDCNTHLVQTAAVYLTDSVCQIAGEQSTIFLGTKQEMRHGIRLEHDYPACYMTTGALHEPHHKHTRLGKNNRAVAIAKHLHEYGFVVLEIVRDAVRGNFAIPRQLWATVEGVLYDIDPVHGGARVYTPEGHTHRPNGIDTLKDGDMHIAGIDETIWRITHEDPNSISTVLKPKHVHVGDTFDNKWGNPHRPRQPVRAAYLAQYGLYDIRAELEATAQRLARLREVLPKKTKIVHEPSNHADDWLQRWINEGRPHDDPVNGPLWCELWLAVYKQLQREGRSMADRDAVEEKSPFGLWLAERLPFIQCPSYQELAGVIRPDPGPNVVRRVYMCHGHIGPKGAETRSIRAFGGYNKGTVGGHVHSATRFNGSDQVGVMTPRIKHYVRGPKTNWTNSHVVVFENGFTAHVFIIYNRWYGDAVQKERKKRKLPV